MYRAPLDSSGNPDWYFYFDTIFPENGLHPYTLDQFTGNAWVAAVTNVMVPDMFTRIRRLEGCVRGSTADASNPDSRLDDLIARVYALQQWANGAGHFGSPPAAGSNATFTVEQLTSYGDVTA